MEMSSLIAFHARYRPQAEAVAFGEQRLNWRAFSSRVDRLANALLALGVRPGDRVATLLPNRLELLEAYWACPRIGAVLVPFSPLLMAGGLASLATDAGISCLITQGSLAGLVRAALPDMPCLPTGRILLTDAAERPENRGFADCAALVAAAPDSPPPVAPPGADDCFNIMYTSGTTGLPKGIMHSHRVRAMYATLFANAWRMTPESVTLHAGAIVFNGAFLTLMPSFLLGGRYVLQPAFEPLAMMQAIARERATHIMVVPAQIVAMLDHPQFDVRLFDSLEMLMSLGAPLPLERKEQINRLLPGRFYELYGLTEGFMTILDRDDAMRKPASVGRPPYFSALRILRDDGSEAATGEIGEICGRAPILMQGYWGKPELTARTVVDGWLHSGDMGYADADGYLHLVDRIKDMIDSGGVKVYPKDIEEIAARHPAVAEVAVFGVPDAKWGETPLAAVVLKNPGQIDAAALRDWINERVGARYQRVREVVLKDAFPRNAAGKTLKRELRAPYWEGLERSI